MVTKGQRDYTSRVNSFERLRFMAEQEKFLIDNGMLIKTTKTRMAKIPKEPNPQIEEIIEWFKTNGKTITEKEARKYI